MKSVQAKDKILEEKEDKIIQSNRVAKEWEIVKVIQDLQQLKEKLKVKQNEKLNKMLHQNWKII